jgi:hypothetical protein
MSLEKKCTDMRDFPICDRFMNFRKPFTKFKIQPLFEHLNKKTALGNATVKWTNGKKWRQFNCAFLQNPLLFIVGDSNDKERSTMEEVGVIFNSITGKFHTPTTSRMQVITAECRTVYSFQMALHTHRDQVDKHASFAYWPDMLHLPLLSTCTFACSRSAPYPPSVDQENHAMCTQPRRTKDSATGSYSEPV